MDYITKISPYAVTSQLPAVGRSNFMVQNFLRPLLQGGLLIVTLMLVLSCQEKTNGQITNLDKDNPAISTDSLSKPNVDIKVNRHYDEEGNLIGYDSTYSSFYSTAQGDTTRLNDMIHGFDTFFKRHHSPDFDRHFNSLFFSDSLRYFDFFHDDFFRKRYELNDSYMQDMMDRMDSIKNHFFREQEQMLNDSKKDPMGAE